MPIQSTKQMIAKAAPPAGLALALACLAGTAGQVVAQEGSLLNVPPALQNQQQDRGLNLANSSYIYRKLPPEQEMRELKVNDIITVLVDYRSSMLSEGDAENRKTNNLNAFLNNWVKFTGKDLTPDPQPNGPLATN
jgi:flagellar L-ring protein FlgH